MVRLSGLEAASDGFVMSESEVAFAAGADRQETPPRRLEDALDVAAALIDDSPGLSPEDPALLEVVTHAVIPPPQPGMEIAQLGLVDDVLEAAEFQLLEDGGGLFEIVGDSLRVRADADPARLSGGPFEIVIEGSDLTGRTMADRIRLVCGA